MLLDPPLRSPGVPYARAIADPGAGTGAIFSRRTS